MTPEAKKRKNQKKKLKQKQKKLLRKLLATVKNHLNYQKVRLTAASTTTR